MDKKQTKDLARFAASVTYKNIINIYFDKLEAEVALKTAEPTNEYFAVKQEWQRLERLNTIKRIRNFIESSESKASREMRSHDKGL